MTKEDFLDYAERFVTHSYGQRFQDLFGLWSTGLSQRGYFVEFGALSGINMSNSYLLERLGWTGIVAEPHPACTSHLLKNRSCQVVTDCVWKKTGEILDFHAVKGRPALSGIGSIAYDDDKALAGARDNFVTHHVRSISLKDMLDRAQAPEIIDFISIDTEGSEMDILAAFDFSAYRFRSLVVEHGFSSMRQPIHDLLSAKGYHRIWPEFSGHDDWYFLPDLAMQGPNSPDAISLLERALHEIPTAPRVDARLRILSGFAQEAGDLETAARTLKLAIESNPDCVATLTSLGTLLASQGKSDEGLRLIEKAIALNPEFLPAQKHRAKLTSVEV